MATLIGSRRLDTGGPFGASHVAMHGGPGGPGVGGPAPQVPASGPDTGRGARPVVAGRPRRTSRARRAGPSDSGGARPDLAGLDLLHEVHAVAAEVDLDRVPGSGVVLLEVERLVLAHDPPLLL